MNPYIEDENLIQKHKKKLVHGLSEELASSSLQPEQKGVTESSVGNSRKGIWQYQRMESFHRKTTFPQEITPKSEDFHEVFAPHSKILDEFSTFIGTPSGVPLVYRRVYQVGTPP